ncbi:hypothetical protein DFH08DRAFT_965930 [Mycena albidolilacea]|uniref:Uncharacterized protein n=1 Tax=Mycena albidolilacea TaxID=1033008 RepID=A0AAD6ZQD1_9AGAR|nr:hypothetical protein DFH08DRAFT_965930 [Mycena albidolilacea]
MSQPLTPVSNASDNAWTPSMPNSDLWTLGSIADASSSMSPIFPKRVIALPTSPLAQFPFLTAPLSMADVVSALMAASPSQPLSIPQSNTPSFSQILQQSRGRAAIGLGHPSASRRCAPLESDSAAQLSPQQLPRINSSTIKRRTERFPARTLYSIAEHPVSTTPTQQNSMSRQGPGTRKRSYAEAASTETSKQHTGRRVVTPTSPITPASPTFTPGSPRCASKHLGSGAFVLSRIALAPRYTSSGAPQAGPAQVQSPRVLYGGPSMAGSPNFQSLDGAFLGIAAAMDKERRGAEKREEVEEREKVLEQEMQDLMYGEDGFIKLKVHTQLRIRFAARRLRMLF